MLVFSEATIIILGTNDACYTVKVLPTISTCEKPSRYKSGSDLRQVSIEVREELIIENVVFVGWICLELMRYGGGEVISMVVSLNFKEVGALFRSKGTYRDILTPSKVREE